MKNNFKIYPILGLMLLLLVWACSKTEDIPAVPKSSAKDISAFAFSGLNPAVNASISGTTISVAVPMATDITALAPSITVSAKATVSPASGAAQNFSSAVTYTVTAEDGTTQKYTVTVTKTADPKSTAKDILTFSFNALSPAVNATIDAAGKTIKATLAAGADATKLVPTITLSPKATISPATGVATDFSKAVTYTVTAEDGSTQAYVVTITVTPTPVDTSKTIKSESDLTDVLEDLGDGVDYVVSANISISGTRVVTVKPGVRIQFDGGNSGFSLGGQAALKMIGTAAKPIILEGKSAVAGSWTGIRHKSNNIENQWEYVTIKNAGGGSDKAGLWLNGIDDAIRISIKNSIFSDNTGYGIYDADDFYSGNHLTGFENNTFTNNTKSALRIRTPEMGSLDSKSSYANNGQKYIEVNRSSYEPDLEIVVKKIDVPYRILKYTKIIQKMTISPGVTLEFASDAGFFISYNNKDASIIAKGTAAEPIKFIGYLPNINALWQGFVLEGGNPETAFTYCIFDGAGSVKSNPCSGEYKAALSFGASPCGNYTGRGQVANCTISGSGGYGIVYTTGDPVTLKDNTFKDNTSADVFLRKQ